MNYKEIITAILLVSDGPVDHIYFEENFNISKTKLFNIYSEINLDLKTSNFGFEVNFNDIEADLLTLDTVTQNLKNFKPPSILRGLSTPALETLSIVAYEQPVTKLKVSEIRGVESESSLRTLEARGLISKSGTLDVPGSPHLYITTKLFLEKLNIISIKELPILGDYFQSPNEEE
jgi:segregation and condensation protein B